MTWLGVGGSARGIFAWIGPRAHTERQIALSFSKQNRLRPHPGKTSMTTLARARLTGIPFPLALPMDKHIDVVALDQNTLDREFQLNILKGLEVPMDVPLDLIQIAGG